MAVSLRWLLVLGITLYPSLRLPPSAAAQDVPSNSPPPISSLRRMTRNSGYIFDGTVLSVERVGEADVASVGAVQITFRVEQAIRGVQNGQVFTIREWAGLWNSGERYRTGERLLLFLYSPSKLGFTSPVGGPMGRFAVDSGGNAIFDNARMAGLSLTPTSRNTSDQTSPELASRARASGQSRMNTRTLALVISDWPGSR